MDKQKQNILMLIILGITIIVLAYFLGFFSNKGDYIITDMWIGDDNKDGYSFCDNCLWIEFDEGCNRRFVYYFENQHDYDKRLEIGSIVDIRFKKVNNKSYIQGIFPKKEYNYCS